MEVEGGGSRSHSDLCVCVKSSQNSPKPVLIFWSTGSILYHVYSDCIHIAKSCWLL